MRGKNRGEKPEEETPLLDSISACARVCMLKLQRLLSAARRTSFYRHGVSTILEWGWGLPNRQTTTTSIHDRVSRVCVCVFNFPVCVAE